MNIAMWHRCIGTHILATWAILCGLNAPASADRLADIKARGTLIIGVSDAIPPFTFRRGGEIVGYDVDLVRGIVRRLGLRAEFVVVSETERVRAVREGKIDLIASTFTHTAERAREVGFSVNIFYSPQVAIVDEASGIRSIAQLAGRTFGVLKGRTSDRNILAVLPSAKFTYLDNYVSAFAGLRNKTLDAFVADNLVLRTNLKKESDALRFFFLPDFKKDREAGFGMPKGEATLKAALDGALLDMERSGEALKVYDAWFGPKSEVPIERTFQFSADR